MKDVLCLATFAAKVLCLVAFVIILRPHGIGTAQAPSKPQYCKMKPVAAQADGDPLVALPRFGRILSDSAITVRICKT